MIDLESASFAEARLEDVRAGRDTTRPLADLVAEFQDP
jgi:hypothetical protein